MSLEFIGEVCTAGINLGVLSTWMVFTDGKLGELKRMTIARKENAGLNSGILQYLEVGRMWKNQLKILRKRAVIRRR